MLMFTMHWLGNPDQSETMPASPEGKDHGEKPKEIEPRSPQAKGRKAKEAKRVEPLNKGQSRWLKREKLRR